MGFRNGSGWLWWMLIAGLPAYAAAIGVHYAVGHAHDGRCVMLDWDFRVGSGVVVFVSLWDSLGWPLCRRCYVSMASDTARV